MKRNIKTKKAYINIAEYIFAAIIILDFRTFWSRSENYSFISGNSIAIVLICIGVSLLLLWGKAKRDRFTKSILTIAIISIYLLLFMVLSKSGVESTIRFILYIDVLILYQCFCREKDKFSLLYKISDIVFCIALFSFFFGCLVLC